MLYQLYYPYLATFPKNDEKSIKILFSKAIDLFMKKSENQWLCDISIVAFVIRPFSVTKIGPVFVELLSFEMENKISHI